MDNKFLRNMLLVFISTGYAWAQGPNSSAKLTNFKAENVEITRGGGQALDHFDLLGAMVNWVEKGTTPTLVVATGKAFPGCSRTLCPYPKHAVQGARRHGKTQPTSSAV